MAEELDYELTTRQKDSLQMDLFTLVDECEGELDRYSNAIGDIEVIPRYIRGKNSPIKLTDVTESEEVVKRNPYMVNGNELVCEVHPATVTRKEKGKQITYLMYPGDREEIIEQVLFMLASNGGLTKHAIPGSAPRYGVQFSLYQIREELKKIGKTKSYDMIRESLIILRDSKIRISQNKNSKSMTITNDVFSAAALETTGTGRARDRCFISFSDYVVEQIASSNYRQYNFDRVLNHKATLARFLHRYIHWNWRNASAGGRFKMETNRVMSAFGKSHLTMERMRRDLRDALHLMVESGHITSVPYSVNNVYQIEATTKLAEEIKRSMQKQLGIKRLSEDIENGKRSELPPPRVFNAE
tara:strand:+ start:991 stop:2061 length:1071 start_codon:yes stop_codon:yes gene_type:complete